LSESNAGQKLPSAFLALSETVTYSAHMKKLIAYFEKLIADRFFGSVTLSFQNGKLCNIKVERNMKLSDL